TSGAYALGKIRHLGGKALAVRFRDRGDGFDPQGLTSSDNADCDFTPVGDKNPGDTHGFTRKSVCPYSTNWPFWVTTSTMVPLTPARTLLKTFITSISPTVVSSVTAAPTLTNGGAPGSGATSKVPNSGAVMGSRPSGIAVAAFGSALAVCGGG